MAGPLHIPGLEPLRTRRHDGDDIAGHETGFAPGLSLRSDPALELGGRWQSPAGRLLELDLTPAGRGGWLGLHLRLKGGPTDDPQGGAAWIGFACRSAAPEELMLRAALRTGGGADGADGFTDHFLARHVLAGSEPRDHLDALYLPACPGWPARAPWCELVLFLPPRALVWHLHDLRVFAL